MCVCVCVCVCACVRVEVGVKFGDVETKRWIGSKFSLNVASFRLNLLAQKLTINWQIYSPLTDY